MEPGSPTEVLGNSRDMPFSSDGIGFVSGTGLAWWWDMGMLIRVAWRALHNPSTTGYYPAMFRQALRCLLDGARKLNSFVLAASCIDSHCMVPRQQILDWRLTRPHGSADMHTRSSRKLRVHLETNQAKTRYLMLLQLGRRLFAS